MLATKDSLRKTITNRALFLFSKQNAVAVWIDGFGANFMVRGDQFMDTKTGYLQLQSIGDTFYFMELWMNTVVMVFQHYLWLTVI